jgi:Ca2+-binding EF-hand superfamily protein
MEKERKRLKKKMAAKDFELDEDVKGIELKETEKKALERVFKQLSTLEMETSSDDEFADKKYQKQIEFNSNKKRMSVDVYFNNPERGHLNRVKNNSILFTKDYDNNDFLDRKEVEEIKLSKKCLRKILRHLNINSNPEDIDLMIWEVDDDADGKVSKKEFINMFKRCIIDEVELEPKRLFYLVQFMLYDKENKKYITEDDTLEFLCSRYGQNKYDKLISEIFCYETSDEKGNEIVVTKDKITYTEFVTNKKSGAIQKRIEAKKKIKDNK